jgi:hypothetical protein
VLGGVRHASGKQATVDAAAAVRLQHSAAPQPGHAVGNLDARDSDRGAVEVGDDGPSGPRGDRIAVGRRPPGDLVVGGPAPTEPLGALSFT